jgi:superfamily II DNA or RNA helicase
MIELRDYQEEAYTGILDAEKEGIQRPLVVHPTGTGKGVLMGGTALRRADLGRTLVLVHREELAAQFIEKLAWQASELETGIVKANRNEVGAPVVVASVQTVQRDNRLTELIASQDRYGDFATVLVDEAHHAPAPTWNKVLTGMGAYRPYGPLTAGFTATPERDNKSLGVWQKIVSYLSIREAIFKGYLVPILPAEVIETRMDMDNVGRSGGDYSGGGLGREMENSGAIGQIADAYVKHAHDRKGVAFTPTIRTAHTLAGALCERGVPAEALDGDTPDDHRSAMLTRLKTGETQVIVNCGVLTEGFDEPTISCVVIARPTRFHGLYVQMVGRGTRKAPGKENLLVLDVVGASRRHELVGLVDLGLNLDKKVKRNPDAEKQACPACGRQDCAEPAHRCQLCHRYLPYGTALEGRRRHDNCEAGTAGKVDVFGASRLAWLPVGDAWVLGAGKETVLMVPDGIDAWKLASYGGNRIKVLHERVPADWAMGIGEDRAKAFLPLAERGKSWRCRPATDAQKSRLVREGLDPRALPRIKTAGDATDLSVRISGKRALRRMGVI